jgi:BirA family transcriptional regulator, biotin operon repressor / biotin---[acetyl-CoA-carboxylase] ligase
MPLKNNKLFLLELDEVESTNNYAMGWIQGRLLPKGHNGVMNGMAVLAYHQTEGKGQRGKNWQSPKGESLSLSIVLKPDFLLATQGFSLLSAIAVAVANVLESYMGDETKIKWPNDLFWRNRKVGGILIENVVKGTHFSYAVAGIGINVSQKSFPPFLENPVSIKQVTGKELSIKDLALKIQQAVVDAVEMLEINTAAFYDAYNQKLFKRDQTVRLKKESRVFETIIKGVNEQGELLTGENGLMTFQFGEVEWRL